MIEVYGMVFITDFIVLLWKSSTRDLGCILALVRNLDIQLDGHVLAFIGSVVTMGWLSMAPGLCATSWEGRWPLAPEKHWLLLSEMLCWRAKQLSVAEGATCGLRAAGTEWKMFDETVNENTWQKPGEVKRFRSANKTGYCTRWWSKKKKGWHKQAGHFVLRVCKMNAGPPPVTLYNFECIYVMINTLIINLKKVT